MKIIKVTECRWDINSLYKAARSPSRRALLGCMLKTGNTHSAIYGGAMLLVRDIENCNGIYAIKPETNQWKNIIELAEQAMLGKLDNFIMSEKDIRSIIKQIDCWEPVITDNEYQMIECAI